MPFVYFIHETGCTDVFKIGKTENHPADRLDQLQTGNPRQLRIYRWIKIGDHSTAEQYIHMRLNHAHIRGEWFRTTCDQIDEECAIIASNDASVVVSDAWQKYSDSDRLDVKLERKNLGKYRGRQDPTRTAEARNSFRDRKYAEKIINLVGFSDEP